MKTLIVYSSKYGTTEKCAKLVGSKLEGEKTYHNINSTESLNLVNYDIILIGTSVYFGKVNSKIQKFINNNKNMLLTKKVGVFLTCFEGGDKVEKNFSSAYPEWLLKHSFTRERLGYEFYHDKMSVMDRFVTKNLIKVKKSTSNLFDKNINAFISNIKGSI